MDRNVSPLMRYLSRTGGNFLIEFPSVPEDFERFSTPHLPEGFILHICARGPPLLPPPKRMPSPDLDNLFPSPHASSRKSFCSLDNLLPSEDSDEMSPPPQTGTS